MLPWWSSSKQTRWRPLHPKHLPRWQIAPPWGMFWRCKPIISDNFKFDSITIFGCIDEGTIIWNNTYHAGYIEISHLIFIRSPGCKTTIPSSLMSNMSSPPMSMPRTPQNNKRPRPASPSLMNFSTEEYLQVRVFYYNSYFQLLVLGFSFRLHQSF